MFRHLTARRIRGAIAAVIAAATIGVVSATDVGLSHPASAVAVHNADQRSPGDPDGGNPWGR